MDLIIKQKAVQYHHHCMVHPYVQLDIHNSSKMMNIK